MNDLSSLDFLFYNTFLSFSPWTSFDAGKKKIQFFLLLLYIVFKYWDQEF